MKRLVRSPSRVVVLSLLGLILPVAVLTAQNTLAPKQAWPKANEVTLFAESWAGGVQYLRHLGGSMGAGLLVGAGPTGGVAVRQESSRDAREWATGYVALAFRSNSGIEAVISPVGVAVVAGNDFATVYPSGQVLLGATKGRLRIGSVMRIVRIAGSFGSGFYQWRWIPLRVGVALGS